MCNEQDLSLEIPPDLFSVAEEDPQLRLDRLRARAEEGDFEARKELRLMFEEYPEIWRTPGNIAARAQEMLIDRTTNDHWFTGEVVRRNLHEMRVELLGKNPTPLEKLAVEALVGDWLWLQHANIELVNAEMNSKDREFWATEKDRSHRQLMSALKHLAMIRSMLSGGLPSGRKRRSYAPVNLIPGTSSNGNGQAQANGNGNGQVLPCDEVPDSEDDDLVAEEEPEVSPGMDGQGRMMGLKGERAERDVSR